MKRGTTMETFTANEAKQHLGRVIDSALQHPVGITKHGRLTVVMTSEKEYQEFLEYKKVKEAVNEGFAQLDKGEISTRSMDDLALAAIARVKAKQP
ncbi:type II toxin-antitoxin system Phd/YefM family antitoxin [Rubritalea squalenifaciens]|nr:type II toxin-antitoxin system Phd/YefM family antitoxin [Rubritalea squalenifaciens]